jgi:hypothetical protein
LQKPGLRGRLIKNEIRRQASLLTKDLGHPLKGLASHDCQKSAVITVARYGGWPLSSARAGGSLANGRDLLCRFGMY